MNYDYDAKIGNRIKEVRKAQKLTQSQLVAKMQLLECEMTRSALAKIEVGQRHIYSWEIKAFKIALGVKFEDLLV